MRTFADAILVALALLACAVPCGAQRALLISPELRLGTRGGDPHLTYTFQMVSTSEVVWEAHREGTYSARITTAERYIDPGDLSLAGADTHYDQDQGWNTDAYPSEASVWGPVLGRGYYRLTAETGDTLRIDCYGTHFTTDVTVVYDFGTGFTVDGSAVTSLTLYYDPTGLQPTPPLDFTCTNAGRSGQHPHFVWERPQAPEGVRCCHRTHHP